MKKKILIVAANYYKDISSGLLKSAINLLPKKSKVNEKEAEKKEINHLLNSEFFEEKIYQKYD